MPVFLITFRSITPAQRGEKLLRKSGLDCTLRRTPRWMEEQGCGYSLQTRKGPEAAQLLRRYQIPFRKVYLQNNEQTEEVVL